MPNSIKAAANRVFFIVFLLLSLIILISTFFNDVHTRAHHAAKLGKKNRIMPFIAKKIGLIEIKHWFLLSESTGLEE
jgi:hypothetical protein